MPGKQGGVGRMANRLAVLGWAIMLVGLGTTRGDQIHQQGFEGREPKLELYFTDGQAKLLESTLITKPVHSGKQAEKIAVRIVGGNFCYVKYGFGRSLVFPELTLSAWVMANRPGTRLYARVVLPRDIDSKSKDPTVVLLRGDMYNIAGRWKNLTLSRLDQLLEQQRGLLQAQRERPIDIRGAYVDMLLLDVQSGVGDVEVVVDDIQIGPIVEGAKPVVEGSEQLRPQNLRDEKGMPRPIHVPEVRDRVQLEQAVVVGDQLQVGGRGHFFVGVRRSPGSRGAPIEILRDAGFNTVFVDWPVAPALADELDNHKLRFVPMLALNDNNEPIRVIRNNQVDIDFGQKALFYHVGGKLRQTDEPLVQAVAGAVRARDPHRGRPLTADVNEHIRSFSRSLDMVGISRQPLMTSLDMENYRRWLAQRRNLGRPGSVYWSWIQTEVPDSFIQMLPPPHPDQPTAPPPGLQPDLIRLQAYAALAAGFRGLAYSSDWALSDATGGRDRMLQVGLLNLELRLMETFLAEGNTPTPIRTSSPDVAAVAISHPLGILIIAYWTRPGAQYLLGQAAMNDLQLVTPGPESAQVYQISLGGMHSLHRQKDLGGIRITIREFDTAAIVVVSTDIALFGEFERWQHRHGGLAADWYKQFAELHLRNTEEGNARLEAMGHGHKEGRSLIQRARQHLNEARSSSEISHTITSAARSVRMSRALRERHWLQAVEKQLSPTAAPYAASFETLPDYYAFLARIRDAQWSENLLPTGNFERRGNLDAVGWSYHPHTSDELQLAATLVADVPAAGQQVLQLKALRDGPIVVAENTRVELVTPTIPVQPGQIVRVRGKLRIPKPIAGSVDGAMVWDTIGGEAFALRFTKSEEWQSFEFYRPVIRGNSIRVHLALTGGGTVQWDDLTIQTARP